VRIRKLLCQLLGAIPREDAAARELELRMALAQLAGLQDELREEREQVVRTRRLYAMQSLTIDNLRVALVMLTEAAQDMLQLFDGAIVHPRMLASFARLREAMQPGVQAAAADQRASDAEEAPQGAAADQPVQP